MLVLMDLTPHVDLMILGYPRARFWAPSFFLYINDLPNATELFTSLFADDTGLLLSSPDLESLFSKVNEELAKAADFVQIS